MVYFSYTRLISSLQQKYGTLMRLVAAYLCHTAYLSPHAASFHSGSLGHQEASPIFMHNLSSIIAEYRFELASKILTAERLCMSWDFLISIWVQKKYSKFRANSYHGWMLG